MRNSILRKIASVILVFVLTASGLYTFPKTMASAADRNDNGLGIEKLWTSLKRLTGVATLLNTNAHPDDERNGTLGAMLYKDGIRTVSVQVTRGAGGQNAIGSESDLPYSALRTRELQEVVALIGGELKILCEEYDNTALDYGFSKRYEEAFRMWDWDVLLERIVRYIRQYRPDVVLQQNSGLRSQHGQHQGTVMLFYAAWLAAADPEMFPEQITEEGLAPYKAPRLVEQALYTAENSDYLNFKGLDFAGGKFENVSLSNQLDYAVTYDGSGLDPILGLSYGQLGQEARYFHISQSMGRTENPSANGSFKGYLVDTPFPAGVTGGSYSEDMFAGIPMTLADLAVTNNENVNNALLKLQAGADGIIDAFPAHAELSRLIHAMIKDAREAIELVKASDLDDAIKYDLNHRLNRKLNELSECSHQAALLALRMRPETFEPFAGQTLAVPVDAYNGGSTEVNVTGVKLNVPEGWTVNGNAATGAVKQGETLTSEFVLTIPENSKLYDPYFDMPMTATVTYEIDGVSNAYTFGFDKNPGGNGAPVRFAVMPQYSMTVSPENYAVNTQRSMEELPVVVGVKSHVSGESAASVSLDAPEGWTVSPEEISLSFASANEVQVAEFSVVPPANFKEESVQIGAKAVRNGVVSNTIVQVIEYPHIGRTYYLYPSVLTVQGIDVAVPEGLKVGYVSGGRDLVYLYLAQVGFDVTLLEPDDILFGDLAQYDTIMTGVRAYRDRADLITASQRLLDYVNNGGNMVVQYMVANGDNWQPRFAPMPLNLGSPSANWRVVEEDSKVTVLAPGHPVFNQPNKIVESDWDGWVQERSIYDIDTTTSDPAWTKLISAMDTDDDVVVPGRRVQDGMIVTANYGKGIYTYNSVVWWRQIQGLVPGAYRILTNIISQKQ